MKEARDIRGLRSMAQDGVRYNAIMATEPLAELRDADGLVTGLAPLATAVPELRTRSINAVRACGPDMAAEVIAHAITYTSRQPEFQRELYNALRPLDNLEPKTRNPIREILSRTDFQI